MSSKHKKNDICITKENFLKVLASLSKEEIHDLIESKGKEPKLVTPVVYLQ